MKIFPLWTLYLWQSRSTVIPFVFAWISLNDIAKKCIGKYIFIFRFSEILKLTLLLRRSYLGSVKDHRAHPLFWRSRDPFISCILRAPFIILIFLPRPFLLRRRHLDLTGPLSLPIFHSHLSVLWFSGMSLISVFLPSMHGAFRMQLNCHRGLKRRLIMSGIHHVL